LFSWFGNTLIIIKSGLSFPIPYFQIGTGTHTNNQHKTSRGKDQIKKKKISFFRDGGSQTGRAKPSV